MAVILTDIGERVKTGRRHDQTLVFYHIPTVDPGVWNWVVELRVFRDHIRRWLPAIMV